MDTSKIRSLLVYLVAVGIGVGAAKLGFDFMAVKFSPRQPANTAGKQAKPAPAGLPARPAAAQVTPANLPVPAAKEEQSPAAPLVKEKKADSSAYLLTGIYLAGDKPLALINNQIVEEGDEISGAKVFKIGLDEVILNLSDGQIIKLTTKSRYP